MLSKDVILFWIERRIRELEALMERPCDEDMARRGISYKDRKEAHEICDQMQGAHRTELEAFRAAKRIVQEAPFFLMFQAYARD